MRWRRATTVVMLGFVSLYARPVEAQQDSLRFFKNYFLTGGYEVGGVGLADQGVGGTAQGTITIGDVPDGAEVVAAFLYAQVVSSDGPDAGGTGVTFHGVALSSTDGSFGAIGDPLGATPCWSSGGGTGQSGGSKRTYSYRYDVLRLLPVVDGRQQANGDHPVTLPDLGNSNSTPKALGASLVVVYRDPDMPLSAIVLYDGTWAMDNATQGMTQTIEGFYDPAPVAGQLTHIVGSGQSNKKENLRVEVNGIDVVSVVNPFTAFEGKAWDNVTIQTPPIAATDSLTTSVDNEGFNSFDCLTWSAVIYRTEVNDADLDGLLDRWETVSGLTDPYGVTLPDLAAMGADPLHKDVFIEAGYMFADGDPTTPQLDGTVLYGPDQKPAHSHLPTAAALQKVGAAFAAAPVDNPDLTTGINVHIDVGDNYQVGGADPYVISVANGARGGESLDEMETVCMAAPDDPPYVCQFSAYPGTIAWKSSYRALRDALLNDPDPDAAPEDDHVCDTPANPGYDVPPGNCDRVFDRNRKDMFRYMFFAHAVGVPKAHCLDLEEFDPGTGDPNPNFGLPDPVCQATDQLFHVPNTYTGIGDWGGADAMVTMGGFDDAAGLPVGTDNQQAGTIMHELGHTMMLTHGGAPGNANCGPNRVSVMNYLFQLRGLPRANGDLTGDYSGQALGALDESSLFETDGIGPAPYRTSWYAPFVGVGTQATRHCNGTVIGPLEPPMVRVGGTTIGGSIDWNTDGNSDDPVPPVTPEFNGLDINFDGVLNDASAPLEGYDDWANLRLNQVGSRRNIGIWYFADEFPYIGPASLDMGRFDFGRFDFGDLNTGDLGRFDFGRFDFGVGAGDLGRGSDGKGGFGRFDFGRFDFGGGADGELTIDLAVAAGLLGPPTDFTVCVGGDVGNPDACVPDPGGGPSVVLTWGAPDASPTTYALYRSDDGGATFVLVGTVDPAAGVDGAFAFTDATVVRGTTYTFYATARYVSGTEVNESATDTDDVTINVVDITAPVVTAPASITVEAEGALTPAATAVIAVFLSSATVVDVIDGDLSAAVAHDAPPAFPLGPTVVTFSATDAALNTGAADATVTVVDTTAPALTAPGAVTVEATGPATVVALGTPTVSDAVDASPVVTNDAPATFPLGPTTVTWTVTDASGNVNTAAQLVTVEDTTAPALTAPGAVTVEATGPATVVALGTPTVSDAVDASPVVTNDAPATFPLGPTTVTDASGNVNTAAQLVTVEDTTAPALTAPGAVTVEATGPATVVALGTPTVSDAVDASPVVTNDAPATFPLGPTTVTWTVTDASGNVNTAAQLVTVEDTTAPALTAPGAVTVEATGPATVVALGTPTVSDAVDASPVVTNDAPATFPLGPTTVTWTVTDASGNVNTAAQLVTVEDTTAPALTAPGAVTVEATGPATVVALGTPTVSDAVDASPVVTNDAPATFPLGPTTVTWTVTDASGNVNTAAQLVTVEDTTAPALTAPGAVTVEATGPATVVALGTPTVSDAVDASPVVTNDAPATFPLGPTTVTWTVTDASGNVNTAAQLVTVEDTTAPAVTAPASITVEAESPLTPATTTTIATFLAAAIAGDTVDGDLTLAVVTNAPAEFPLGPTVVTFSATDAALNTGTADATVTVVDTTAPVTTATLQGSSQNGWFIGPVTVTLAATDSASAIADTSCFIDGTECGASPFVVTAEGIHTIQFWSTDTAGVVEAAQTVEVRVDATAPLVSASANPPTLWPPNNEFIPVTVSGVITDSLSGPLTGPGVATYSVADEYGQIEPTGPVTINPDGSYAVEILLRASRRGNDSDGRLYTIFIAATDLAGNLPGVDTSTSVNVHDQGQ